MNWLHDNIQGAETRVSPDSTCRGIAKLVIHHKPSLPTLLSEHACNMILHSALRLYELIFPSENAGIRAPDLAYSQLV